MSDILSFPVGTRILVGAERDLAVPEGANEAFARYGGLNRFGEPNYRFVWGWSRKDWKAGEWIDRKKGDEYKIERRVIEARYVPKYPQRERFHAEIWWPPEHYGSRELWDVMTRETIEGQNVPQLGPYPSRGDYEHLRIIETRDGRFVWPTAEIARLIVQLNRLARDRSSSEIKASIDAEEAAEKAATKAEVRGIIDDKYPAFGLRPHVAMPGFSPFEKAS